MLRWVLPFFLSRAAAFTLAGGLATTLALFAGVGRLEADNMALAFSQRADMRVATMGHGLDEAVEVLMATHTLFAAVGPVTRAQYRDFTAPLLERHPFIQAFSFRRLVSDAERAAVEAELGRLRPGLTFTELVDGQLVPVPHRPQYRVVTSVEPLAGNEAALGLDVTNNDAVMDALRLAEASGRPTATRLFAMAQNNFPEPSFAVMMPVYARSDGTGARGALLGETAVMLRGRALVQQIMARAGLLNDTLVALALYSGDRPDPATLVYASAPQALAPLVHTPWYAPARQASIARTLSVAGRNWLVTVTALPRPFLLDHLGSLLVLLGGLFCTIISTAFVQVTTRRTRRINRVVEERTTDLKDINARLVDDVSARRRTEKALQDSEQRFRQLVALSSDWYWEQDARLRFTAITGGLSSKGGIKVESLLGRTLWEAVPGMRESAWGERHIAQLEARQPFMNVEYEAFDDAGVRRWYAINGEPIFDELGNFLGYRGTGSDITERKEAEQRVHHVAQHDALTGLPNRSLLQDRLGQAVALAHRTALPVWVMLIDLDRFKFVNDSMGHKAGDVLLMTIAERLRSALRDTDTVARLSGDEFVVVLSAHADHPLSPEIIERVMASVARPVMLGANEFFVTCSVGVAVYPQHGAPADTLIEHADIAMYNAKKLGRNNFQFYTPLMNEEALERVKIESALRNALERNEFVLHYQPQVHLGSGEIVGMEALIRWRHPELGMVAPIRFIGVAEETGLIVQIGAWVMRTACAQNMAWQQAGLGNLRVAVNLSARQFGAADLVPHLEKVLAETGLAPASLEIELTESLFMSDITPAVETLHRIKALGVNLSIDDFGTGYSSLSYLSRFPIDVLKIDRSFVSDIGRHGSESPIVASIITLAHNLKLAVIAEGVETLEQLDYLRRMGCDEIQGYYFSRPLPADEFEQLLRRGHHLPPAAAQHIA
ncbi:MAG: EAL domain-containing protein [Pseudomonadota bacterium]|nr:EAL domain-containing protein [Pseudomonadota bacterium]